MGRIIAIDYGQKRTGLAATDKLRISAHALDTVRTCDVLPYLTRYCEQEEVDEMVVGHPKQMSGDDSDSMQYIRPFIAQLQSKFPTKKITLYDERFTSVLAHRAMIEGGMKRKQRQDKAVVDKIAATIILTDYLNATHQ